MAEASSKPPPDHVTLPGPISTWGAQRSRPLATLARMMRKRIAPTRCSDAVTARVVVDVEVGATAGVAVRVNVEAGAVCGLTSTRQRVADSPGVLPDSRRVSQ